jgi:hypothetical protein
MNAGWVVLALAVVAVAGHGLKRLAEDVLLTKGDSCRLEGDQ